MLFFNSEFDIIIMSNMSKNSKVTSVIACGACRSVWIQYEEGELYTV